MADRDYWEARKNYRYYARVRAVLDELSPALSLLDVGSGPTPIATWGEFQERFSVDVRNDRAPGENVIHSVCDWLDFDAAHYSVVTCLQCLEHIPDETVVPFARKLLRHGDTVIVSVPYMWRKGLCKGHLQDPVSLKKVTGWIGREPDHWEKVEDGGNCRLICVYKAGH